MKKSEKKIKEPFIDNDKFVNYYGYFHLFITIISVALYLKCSANKGFNKRSFTFALCCPHLYLLYTIATKGYIACFAPSIRNDDDSSSSESELI